ncbi:MAG: hypothetical protein JXA90_12915 [Planctomycetes bacterium]|nr:hypothetical protein [Planctomycetota bacterium]
MRSRSSKSPLLGLAGVLGAALLPTLCLGGLIPHPCFCESAAREAHEHVDPPGHSQTGRESAGECSHDGCEEDPCKSWLPDAPPALKDRGSPQPLDLSLQSGSPALAASAGIGTYLAGADPRSQDRQREGPRATIPYPPADRPLLL